ncbi:response regulator [Paenibacillus wynnii]|uniref:response regulator n=1 Tax=Paenibacillus wynnii TaxID=268407 RepID=UPI002790E1C6|nr:response regulator [Paenibacillus wynnii]MDQ0192450.1 two-component system chemotaxis response regulator CheY [Paenibacillus wynnii]
MKILVAEDDLVSRKFLSKFLTPYGEVDTVVDGLEALDAYLLSLKDNDPYDLLCLDIMMPRVDGVKVLKAIRDYETQKGISLEKRLKVIMTTALAEADNVKQSFEYGCEAYAAKPINTDKFLQVLRELGLIE